VFTWDVWKSALMIFSMSSFNVLRIPEDQIMVEKHVNVNFLSEQQGVSLHDYVEAQY
jgi:hypothetical protein